VELEVLAKSSTRSRERMLGDYKGLKGYPRWVVPGSYQSGPQRKKGKGLLINQPSMKNQSSLLSLFLSMKLKK